MTTLKSINPKDHSQCAKQENGPFVPQLLRDNEHVISRKTQESRSMGKKIISWITTGSVIVWAFTGLLENLLVFIDTATTLVGKIF